MTDRICIRPAAGVRVRRPTPPYKFLDDEPTVVNVHSYWYRRLLKGDVIECPMPDETKSPKKEKI
jgi:hypothetical protein